MGNHENVSCLFLTNESFQCSGLRTESFATRIVSSYALEIWFRIESARELNGLQKF